MKKYIVLSVNDNQDYLYFTPLVCWAWRKLGWKPILLYQGTPNILTELINETFDVLHSGMSAEMKILYTLTSEIIPSIEGYRSDTITQISRLYAQVIYDGRDFAMIGDIDMIPLSDYWNPNPDKVTVYGHDLTGFGHYPMCYIAMKGVTWGIIMGTSDRGIIKDYIKRDLDTLPQAKDPDFYKYWFSDQDLITQRLNEYGKEKITFINRGQGSHGYARGRVDRGSGGWVLDQPELIDAHLRQQTHHKKEKVLELIALLQHVWPNENFDWFMTYSIKFRQLTGHTA